MARKQLTVHSTASDPADLQQFVAAAVIIIAVPHIIILPLVTTTVATIHHRLHYTIW